MEEAVMFGLLFFVDPKMDSESVDVFWSPEKVPYILNCTLIEHIHTAYDDEVILADLSLRLVCVETADGYTHLILKDGCCSLQLRFEENLDLNTFFDFEIHIPAYANMLEKIYSASCLAQFLRNQKCDIFKKIAPIKVERLIQTLYAYDLSQLGMSHREIAFCLFGEAAILGGWDGVSDNIRSRTRRLIRHGNRLVKAGYSTFLKSTGK